MALFGDPLADAVHIGVEPLIRIDVAHGLHRLHIGLLPHLDLLLHGNIHQCQFIATGDRVDGATGQENQQQPDQHSRQVHSHELPPERKMNEVEVGRIFCKHSAITMKIGCVLSLQTL